MITIRLRHADVAGGKVLDQVPWNMVDAFFESVCRWGVTHDGYDYSREHISGNFVLDSGGGAYFEIVVGVE